MAETAVEAQVDRLERMLDRIDAVLERHLERLERIAGAARQAGQETPGKRKATDAGPDMAMSGDAAARAEIAARAADDARAASEGKVAVDIVSLIVRTLEKVDGLRRAIAADREAARKAAEAYGAGGLDDGTREALARRIADRIDELASQRAVRMFEQHIAALAEGFGEDGRVGAA